MEMQDETQNLSIGQLARRSGVSVKTIRFYSDAGLLPHRSVDHIEFVDRAGIDPTINAAAMLAKLANATFGFLRGILTADEFFRGSHHTHRHNSSNCACVLLVPS